MNKEFLAKLKEGVHKGWKQKHVTWREYRDTVQACRSVVRKVKAQLELNVARVVMDNKKGFYKCTGDKRKAKENVALLLNGGGKWCPATGQGATGTN